MPHGVHHRIPWSTPSQRNPRRSNPISISHPKSRGQHSTWPPHTRARVPSTRPLQYSPQEKKRYNSPFHAPTPRSKPFPDLHRRCRPPRRRPFHPSHTRPSAQKYPRARWGNAEENIARYVPRERPHHLTTPQVSLLLTASFTPRIHPRPVASMSPRDHPRDHYPKCIRAVIPSLSHHTICPVEPVMSSSANLLSAFPRSRLGFRPRGHSAGRDVSHLARASCRPGDSGCSCGAVGG